MRVRKTGKAATDPGRECVSEDQQLHQAAWTPLSYTLASAACLAFASASRFAFASASCLAYASAYSFAYDTASTFDYASSSIYDLS